MTAFDPALRARLGNVGHLLSGNAATAMVGLGAVALTARALGPADYGILALVLAYTRAVERLVTFQSWQPLIKYGAALNGPDDAANRSALYKFGLALDVGGALLAWVVAVGIALVAAPLLGWAPRTLNVILIYSLVLPFNLNGMATAVLRLYGKYRIAAYGPVGGGVLRLILCGAALLAVGRLESFVAIWMLTQIVGALFVLAFAFRVLRANGVHGVLRAPLVGAAARFDGIWSFAWSSNLSLTLRSSANQLDVLIVGALAGPVAAGLYNIAKRVGRLAEQVSTQVQAVLYPDIARLWAAGAIAEMRRAVFQVEAMLLVAGALGVAIFAVIAAPLLQVMAGPGFVGAAPLLVMQMVAVMLTMTGTGARAALLSMGRQRQLLLATLAGTVAFHVTTLLLVPRIGAMGANIAHIVLATIVSAILIIDFRRALKLAKTPAATSGATPAG